MIFLLCLVIPLQEGNFYGIIIHVLDVQFGIFFCSCLGCLFLFGFNLINPSICYWVDFFWICIYYVSINHHPYSIFFISCLYCIQFIIIEKVDIFYCFFLFMIFRHYYVEHFIFRMVLIQLNKVHYKDTVVTFCKFIFQMIRHQVNSIKVYFVNLWICQFIMSNVLHRLVILDSIHPFKGLCQVLKIIINYKCFCYGCSILFSIFLCCF